MSDEELLQHLWVQCGDCKHQWPLIELPIDLGYLPEFAECPACKADHVYVIPPPQQDDHD